MKVQLVLDVIDAPETMLWIFNGHSAHHPVHFIALLEKELREIGSILPGDSGDEGFLRHVPEYLPSGLASQIRPVGAMTRLADSLLESSHPELFPARPTLPESMNQGPLATSQSTGHSSECERRAAPGAAGPTGWRSAEPRGSPQLIRLQKYVG